MADTLPLADRIREARAAAEAAQRARVELAETIVSLQTLQIRREVLTNAGQPLDPDHDAQIAALQQRVESLQPHADSAQVLSQQLTHLLGHQHHALHHPGHEETIERVKKIGRERQEVWDQLEPVWQRVKVLDPVAATLTDHVSELDAAIAAGGDAAPVAERSGHIVTGVEQAMVAIGFEVSVPEPPPADWKAIGVVADRLRELRDILDEERVSVRARADEAQALYDRLGAEIEAITG